MEKLLNNVLYIHIVLRMPQDFLIFSLLAQYIHVSLQ